ncbi:unnamed protein product [Oncorhynchus mykiss]|uniref:ubiquitinyl hydrolase 1 n=1 Tax=Oncorhynchus mykiss TaxID=8022 RepID=A0A060YLZ5_ONCMY|nr:unnamed protein product [Oncorhynchus mykiss]
MCSREEPHLMEAFSQVLLSLWDVNEENHNTEVNPGKFYSIFKDAVPYFSGYSQQDAQEFLRFLLDRLHCEINRRPYVRLTSLEPEPKCTTVRIDEQASAMWKRHLERDDSKIVVFNHLSAYFRVGIKSLQCSRGQRQSCFCNKLKRQGASGPPPSVELPGWLLHFVFQTCMCVLQMCERCNRRTESTKRLTIQRFPQVIVMHLNRFAMSRYMVCRSTVCVSFPLTSLDLGPYGPVDCGPVLYDLYAVCNHSGTVNMGHYTACCLENDGSGWCCYNDSWSVTHRRTQTQALTPFLGRLVA